jgi:hypothetical protein
MTVTEAYELACREVDAQSTRSQATAGTFVDDRNQVRQIPHSVPFEHMPRDQRPAVERVNAMQGLGGQPCLEHREKVHTFADGTVMKCCTHTFCGWGRSTKNHSDGTSSGTLYSPGVLDAVDDAVNDDEETLSPDEVQELDASMVLIVRGDDIDDIDDIDDEVTRVERAADKAATDCDEEEADEFDDYDEE